MIPIPDPHVHTQYCGHAQDSVEDMVQSAVNKGLSGLGFAEHFPYPEGYSNEIEDAVAPSEQWPDYLAEVLRMQEKYEDRISIRLAAEVDYLPDYLDPIQAKLSMQDYDYLYGSIHLVDDVLVDYSESYLQDHLEALGGVSGLWEKYWNSMEHMIQIQFCDIVTHLDLPKKFKIAEPAPENLERVGHILNLIKEQNLTLEVNTGGLDRTASGEPYPSYALLKMAAEKKVDILIGSDAHRSEEIGRHFLFMIDQLKSCGFTSIVTYEKRKKMHIRI